MELYGCIRNSLYNTYVLVTSLNKELYFNETQEEINEIECHCSLCHVTKNIGYFFCRELHYKTE